MEIGNIQDEMRHIDLVDSRLERLAASLLTTLSSNAGASINEACRGWAESKAAYRLFDNDFVQPEQILEAQRKATTERIRQESIVCVAQDTTELEFTPHPPKDARHLDRPERYGLYDHTSLVLTREKLALGVIDEFFFDRAKESLGTSSEREQDPIETKDGYRWLEGYRRCCELAAQCTETKIVSLSDREGDIYDIFVEARNHEVPAD